MSILENKLNKFISCYREGRHGVANKHFNDLFLIEPSLNKNSFNEKDDSYNVLCNCLLDNNSFFQKVRIYTLLSYFYGEPLPNLAWPQSSVDANEIFNAKDFNIQNLIVILSNFKWSTALVLLYIKYFKKNRIKKCSELLIKENIYDYSSNSSLNSFLNLPGYNFDALKIVLNLTRSVKNTYKNIAFFVAYLPVYSNKKSAHLTILVNLILQIQSLPQQYNIKLFFTDNSHKFGNDPRETEANYSDNLKHFIGGRIEYEELQSSSNSLKLINEFSPNIACYLGGIFESKPIRFLYFDFLPTIFFFFNQKNKVDKKIDVAVSNQKFTMNGPLNENALKTLSIPVYQHPKEAVYEKGIVKKSQDEFTLVCALTQNRIANVFSKYSLSQLDRIFHFFDKHPSLRWVLLGPTDAEAILSIDSRFRELSVSGRLDIIEFEPHLRSYLEHCDLFVSFPGFGGGGTGGVMARLEQCPVLCYEGSDICLKEVPDLIEIDESSFYETLEQLIVDQELRQVRTEIQYKYLKDNFLSLNSANFAEIINEAVNRFNIRLQFSENI